MPITNVSCLSHVFLLFLPLSTPRFTSFLQGAAPAFYPGFSYAKHCRLLGACSFAFPFPSKLLKIYRPLFKCMVLRKTGNFRYPKAFAKVLYPPLKWAGYGVCPPTKTSRISLCGERSAVPSGLYTITSSQPIFPLSTYASPLSLWDLFQSVFYRYNQHDAPKSPGNFTSMHYRPPISLLL